MNEVKFPEGSVLLRNLFRNFPLISHGHGMRLYDKSGKEYLDASGGALVNSVGHGNERVARRIFEQIGKVAYVNGTHFSSDVMEEAANKLSSLMPSGINKVALLSSGSEAIEAAVKFVRQLWVERSRPDKSVFISRTPGYHGNTLFALSASARPHYRRFYAPLLSDVKMIPAPYEYRFEGDYQKDGASHYATALEDCIKSVGPDRVAGFLVEPVSGSSVGGNVPPPGYLKAIEKICRKHHVMIIADEVLCGAGRTGKFLASEHQDFQPDIVVLGKGINGGYMPVSALVVKSDHVTEMRRGGGGFMHAQTYLQAPSMAACVNAVLDEFRDRKLVANAATQGLVFQKLLREKLGSHPHIGFINGIGLLAGVEFVSDRKDRLPFARQQKVAERFVEHAFSKGMILWPNTGQADGSNGDLVMLGPYLGITRVEVEELVSRLEEIVKSFDWPSTS